MVSLNGIASLRRDICALAGQSLWRQNTVSKVAVPVGDWRSSMGAKGRVGRLLSAWSLSRYGDPRETVLLELRVCH
jgi:hypothetical protein